MSYNTGQKITGTLAGMVEAWNNWLANKRAEQLQGLKIGMDDYYNDQSNQREWYNAKRGDINSQAIQDRLTQSERDSIAEQNRHNTTVEGETNRHNVAVENKPEKGVTPSARFSGIQKIIQSKKIDALERTKIPVYDDSGTLKGYTYDYKNPEVDFWDESSSAGIDSAKTLYNLMIGEDDLPPAVSRMVETSGTRNPGAVQPPTQPSLGDLLKQRGRYFGQAGDNSAKMTAEEADISNQVIKLKSTGKKIGWEAMMRDHPNYNWALIKQSTGE